MQSTHYVKYEEVILGAYLSIDVSMIHESFLLFTQDKRFQENSSRARQFAHNLLHL